MYCYKYLYISIIRVFTSQYGRCKLGHTVKLHDYDVFSKGDIVQDTKYPNVLVYMHPGLPGSQPTMVRFLKSGFKEREAADHALHTWLLSWVEILRKTVSSTNNSDLIDPLTQGSIFKARLQRKGGRRTPAAYVVVALGVGPATICIIDQQQWCNWSTHPIFIG